MMYIYKITNKVNNKTYIGQTVQKNPKMRWYSHLAEARHGSNHHLYNSIRKYGVENFLWEVIDTANSIEDLNKKEEHWLEHFKKITVCYNLRKAGGNKLHTKESKLKMSQAQKEAHARRRAEGRDGGWKRIDGGPMLGKSHPKKGKPCKKWTAEMRLAHSIRCMEREAMKRLLREGE